MFVTLYLKLRDHQDKIFNYFTWISVLVIMAMDHRSSDWLGSRDKLASGKGNVVFTPPSYRQVCVLLLKGPSCNPLGMTEDCRGSVAGGKTNLHLDITTAV